MPLHVVCELCLFWLHSDMKDVAFYYNYKFYEKVAEKGELK